jgi:hypothetical protein
VNYALSLQRPAPIRMGLFVMLSIAFLLASAVSLAPTFGSAASLAVPSAASHSEVCKCAHCSGGPTCCCRLAGKCPTP